MSLFKAFPSDYVQREHKSEIEKRFKLPHLITKSVFIVIMYLFEKRGLTFGYDFPFFII